MSNPCHNCDKPVATPQDFAAICEGEGDHLCWAAYTGMCLSADWRGRYLEAESRIAELERERDEARSKIKAIGDLLSHNGCDCDCEGPCQECLLLEERSLACRIGAIVDEKVAR